MAVLAGVVSPCPSILLADAGELIRLLIFFVVIGVSLLGKLLSAPPRNQPGPRRRPRRPPDPQRGRPAPAGGAQARGPGDGPLPTTLDIERELEQFLQRGGRPQRPRRAEPEPAVVAEVVTPLRDPEATAAGTPLGQGVTSHVQEHLQAGRVSEHARQLGSELSHADEQVEGRLRQIFQHDLGSLAKTATGNEREIAQGTDASVWGARPELSAHRLRSEIVQMLQSPQDVRKVIVLAEILKRPTKY
jgi:hypothetical protein